MDLKKQKSLDTAIGMDRATQGGRQAGRPRCVVPDLFIKQYKNYKSCYYKYKKLLKLEGKLEEDKT